MRLCKFAKYQIDLLMAKKMDTVDLIKRFNTAAEKTNVRFICQIMKNDSNNDPIK